MLKIKPYFFNNLAKLFMSLLEKKMENMKDNGGGVKVRIPRILVS